LVLLRVVVLGAAIRNEVFLSKNNELAESQLAGNVREVWGSTRGTPMPCRWFLEFVEWQALRCYRTVVLG
jgi:hypothetical protein